MGAGNITSTAHTGWLPGGETQPMIDLHAHTTSSDGTASVPELLQLAVDTGLTTVAITDHDTVAGCLLAQPPAGLEFIPGVELSAEHVGTCHLLGYHIDPRARCWDETGALLRQWRDERNVLIIERLRALGLPIDLASVEALAGDAVIGRPHMARVLLERGAVESVKDAFTRYLASDRPAYVPRRRLSPADSIALIHQAGGAVVLAHPYQLRLDDHALAATVSELVADGLDGLEVYYSQHTPVQVACYASLADAHGLHDDDVVAGRFAHQHGLARLGGHAAQRAAGGARADIGLRLHRQALHAGLVAEDRAARDGRRRVDRQHGDAVALLDQGEPQRLDEGALAHARHAADAQAERPARVRQQLGEQRVGLRAMVGTRGLQQRDRLGDGAALLCTLGAGDGGGSRRGSHEIGF